MKVNRISDHGLYLIDDEETEVLLPNRYVSLENKIGDILDVFVYHDSEQRMVATIEHPLVPVRNTAFTRVIDKPSSRASTDWCLTSKDRLPPNPSNDGRVEGSPKVVG